MTTDQGASPRAEHTPVPWRSTPHCKYTIECDRGEWAATRGGDQTGDYIPKRGAVLILKDRGPETEANRDFIIRAVNAHDELVAVCKEAAIALGEFDLEINTLGHNGPLGARALKTLSAALAKLEQKP